MEDMKILKPPYTYSSKKKKKLHIDQAGKQIVFPIAESQTFE